MRAIAIQTHSFFSPVLAGICGMLSLSASAQISYTAAPASVTVHIGTQTAGTVAPAIFGSFLEPIGNSINNGIVAEILVNRSLEAGLWNHDGLEELFREQPELIESTDTTGIPLPWRPLNKAAGNRYELHVGEAANSWQSLEILGQPEELTGIQQRVYLPVQRELTYNVSVYAKHIGGPAQLTFSLRSHSTSAILAQATVNADATQWTKYTAQLVLKPGQVQRLDPVNFAVSVEGAERVDVDQFSLMPADAVGGVFDPDAIAMAKAMHLTELRLGGNFSSYYHWQEGVGPVDKRPTEENIAWGIPEYNILGTDEFLMLCDLIGATPQFNLNMGSGTPEEAAAWVRYIGAHHSGPVIYELGNELYGKWQVGYPVLSELAARTLAFSKAVMAVDPHAMMIATGEGPVGGHAWMAAQLSNPPGTFDDLSLHFILGTNHPEKESLGPDFDAASAYALQFAVGPYFDKAKAQTDAVAGMQSVKFAVTEWLFNSKGYGERNFTNESPSWMNQGGAVMAGGFLNTMLRHTADINLADMTGMMEFAGIWKRREQIYAVPSFYVFQMYTQVKGDSLLPVTSDSGSYSLQGGIKPLDNVSGIPLIDVVATRSSDGKTLTLLCVNRGLDRDTPTTFDLGPMRMTSSARMQQIASVSRYERNDEVEPVHVIPLLTEVKSQSASELQVILPHESVSVLRVNIR
jgi:alpha-N-arabinofuranosidase